MDLYVLSALAGIFVLVATMALLYKGRIYLDSETGAPVEFEFPWLGKVSTQTPVIAIILVGAVLVIVPMFESLPEVGQIKGELKTNGESITMWLVAVPSYQYYQSNSGSFSHRIPLLADSTYRAIFMVGNRVVDNRQVTIDKKEIDVGIVEYLPKKEEDTAIARIGGVQ